MTTNPPPTPSLQIIKQAPALPHGTSKTPERRTMEALEVGDGFMITDAAQEVRVRNAAKLLHPKRFTVRKVQREGWLVRRVADAKQGETDMLETHILVSVKHAKPIPGLVDFVQQRAWNIDGVNVSGQEPAVVATELDGPELRKVLELVAERDRARAAAAAGQEEQSTNGNK